MNGLKGCGRGERRSTTVLLPGRCVGLGDDAGDTGLVVDGGGVRRSTTVLLPERCVGL